MSPLVVSSPNLIAFSSCCCCCGFVKGGLRFNDKQLALVVSVSFNSPRCFGDPLKLLRFIGPEKWSWNSSRRWELGFIEWNNTEWGSIIRHYG